MGDRGPTESSLKSSKTSLHGDPNETSKASPSSPAQDGAASRDVVFDGYDKTQAKARALKKRPSKTSSKDTKDSKQSIGMRSKTSTNMRTRKSKENLEDSTSGVDLIDAEKTQTIDHPLRKSFPKDAFKRARDSEQPIRMESKTSTKSKTLKKKQSRENLLRLPCVNCELHIAIFQPDTVADIPLNTSLCSHNI